MADRNIPASFRLRRDTAAHWEAKNPVLDDGEFITVYTSSGATRHKVGDGVKTYNQLPFTDEPLYNALSGKADKDETVNITLDATKWTNGVQTVAVSGLGADSNASISLPYTATTAQYNAASVAAIEVTAQADEALTFACSGTVPDIDIPIVVVIRG